MAVGLFIALCAVDAFVAVPRAPATQVARVDLRQAPVVASAEWLEPAAHAALAVVSVAGVTVAGGTAIMLASSAEFMLAHSLTQISEPDDVTFVMQQPETLRWPGPAA